MNKYPLNPTAATILRLDGLPAGQTGSPPFPAQSSCSGEQEQNLWSLCSCSATQGFESLFLFWKDKQFHVEHLVGSLSWDSGLIWAISIHMSLRVHIYKVRRKMLFSVKSKAMLQNGKRWHGVRRFKLSGGIINKMLTIITATFKGPLGWVEAVCWGLYKYHLIKCLHQPIRNFIVLFHQMRKLRHREIM